MHQLSLFEVHEHNFYLSGSSEAITPEGYFRYAYKFKCINCKYTTINSGFLPEGEKTWEKTPKNYKEYWKKKGVKILHLGRENNDWINKKTN